jgi:NAD(P)-dependent dehydrogenase (short-subunit alcohol dehydrogenase family)
MQISGCSAVVTGGTGGMGEATVRRLHAAGARVVVADINDEKGKALKEELGIRYVRTNAGSEDDVSAAFAEAAALGPVRISVDVHGGPAAGGRLLSKDGKPMDLAGYRTTIESYLISFFNVMRLAAAAIAATEPANEDGARGVIVETASIAAYEGQIGQLPYSAAKGGMVAMTLVAARDLSPMGVRVVTIAPGTIVTPAYGKASYQIQAHWGPQVPHPKRMGRPEEYAALVQAIVENDYLNGEVIRLDGALRFPPKLGSGPQPGMATTCGTVSRGAVAWDTVPSWRCAMSTVSVRAGSLPHAHTVGTNPAQAGCRHRAAIGLPHWE